MYVVSFEFLQVRRERFIFYTEFSISDFSLAKIFSLLKIMNSISEECNDLKKRYDACFNTWYTENFLRGDTKSDPCRELFESYRTCVMVRRAFIINFVRETLKICEPKVIARNGEMLVASWR